MLVLEEPYNIWDNARLFLGEFPFHTPDVMFAQGQVLCYSDQMVHVWWVSVSSSSTTSSSPFSPLWYFDWGKPVVYFLQYTLSSYCRVAAAQGWRCCYKHDDLDDCYHFPHGFPITLPHTELYIGMLSAFRTHSLRALAAHWWHIHGLNILTGSAKACCII